MSEVAEALKKKIVWVKTGDLIGAEYNPRDLSDNEFYQLKESVRKFGMDHAPIVANSAENRKNIVISGHQRLKVAQSLGMEKVPVIYYELPNIDEEIELNLRMNNNTGHNVIEKMAILDRELLERAGLDRKTLEQIEKLAGTPEEKPEVDFTEELMEEHNYVVLFFDNSVDWLQAESMLGLKPVAALHTKKGFEAVGQGRVIKGIDAINKIKEEVRRNEH